MYTEIKQKELKQFCFDLYLLCWICNTYSVTRGEQAKIDNGMCIYQRFDLKMGLMCVTPSNLVKIKIRVL